MNVEFLVTFQRDLDKIQISSVKNAVRRVVLRIESAQSLSEIPNVKKLAGHESAYRIRIGDYRIGIFVDGNAVEFARIIHRKDIYKLFP